MGVITSALIIGMSALSAVSQIKQANDQAKQIVAEGNIATREKAKEVQAKAARLQSSFLSSGLTLEGTPESIIESTFNTGLEDINQTRSNYNSQAKNVVQSARTQALTSFATSLAGTSFGGSGSSMNMGSIGNGFGQTVGSAFSSSPTGPYLPFGVSPYGK